MKALCIKNYGKVMVVMLMRMGLSSKLCMYLMCLVEFYEMRDYIGNKHS